MDAGLAAVLGAAAGAVGGVVGSIVTGRVQRDGVLVAVRAEHLKERRQPRHDAYRAFIQTILNLKERIDFDSYENTHWREEEALKKEINTRWIDLSLYGPDSVIAGASRVRDIALNVVHEMGVSREAAYQLMRMDEEDGRFDDAQDTAGLAVDGVYSAARVLADAVDEFALTASAALNDDGTKRPRFLRVSRGSV
ncbi:hypothetical protein [Streptomyces olivaceoviridis]|uniref:hypothetical protein n=1 Tax=Streptomyces olivaceoviridis TaxID=1921 RepID=UPI0037B2E8D4